MSDPLERQIREHPAFSGLTDADYATLAGCARLVKLGPGEVLAKNGDPADRTWLVRAGRVSLIVHGAETSETIEEGGVIGWSWLYPPYRWHFDAVARSAVRAIELDGDKLREACEADPRFGFALAKRFLFYAQRRLERARLKALDVYGGPGR